MKSPCIRWRAWPWELVTDIKLPAGYFLYRSKQSGVLDLVYGGDEWIRWFNPMASDREILTVIDDHMALRLDRGDELLYLIGEVWPA